MKYVLTATLVGLLASAAIGCGSDSKSVPATSGLGSKTFASLTPAEKAQLCDWLAAKGGGYGKTMMCANGEMAKNDSTQAACVSMIPSCELTVTEYEVCANVVLAVPLCDQENKFITAQECTPVFASCFP